MCTHRTATTITSPNPSSGSGSSATHPRTAKQTQQTSSLHFSLSASSTGATTE